MLPFRSAEGAAPVAEIDLERLRENFLRLRSRAPGARFLAVVKADAYGHGALEVARALAEADGFGVARLEEGIALREGGIERPIVVFCGPASPEQLPHFVHYRLTPVLHLPWQCELACRTSGLEGVWLKLETGMHRLGLEPGPFLEFYPRLARRFGEERVVLMTHLACADSPGHPLTSLQLERFFQLTSGLPSPRSFASSASLLLGLHQGSDWIRPGLALYGISPLPQKLGSAFGLRPVMTLKARLLALKRVARGEAVGYGATWRAARESRLGVVAAGYGDGYPREVAPGSGVLISGRRVPISGRVSMDLLTVDLTDSPAVQEGEEVVLWGEGLPVEEVAQAAGTIPYTLLCRLSRRVRYIYL